MPIITLTTDWNSYDYYVGALKGQILQECAETNIVDLSHSVHPYNLSQAAFIIKHSYPNFPKGTIHINGVNSEAAGNMEYIVVKADDHFFITADNGIMGLIFDETKGEIFKIADPPKPVSGSFRGLSYLVSAAVRLCKKVEIDKLGESLNSYKRHVPMRPVIEGSVIIGSIIYIDSFQNAITNISKELFDSVGQKRKFEMYIQSNYYKINKINNTYSETASGELLALFNSVDLLEIAIRDGMAAQLLNLSTNSTVRIKFLSD